MIGSVSNNSIGFSGRNKVFEKSEAQVRRYEKYLERKASAFVKKNERKQLRDKKHLLSQLPTHDTFVAERLATS